MRVSAVVPAMLAIAISACSLPASAAPATWNSGAFWTYEVETVAVGTGETYVGEMMVIALAYEASFGVPYWHLAVITDWFDGSDLLFLTTHWCPTSLELGLRWPQVVDFLPPSALPGASGSLRHSMAPVWLPVVSGGEELRMEMLTIGGAEEALALMALPRSTVAVPMGDFQDSVNIGYAWSIAGAAGTSGEAAWSSVPGWWVRIEGSRTSGGQRSEEYVVILSDYGTMEHAAMIDRLALALTSSAQVDTEWADALRNRLEAIGIDLTSRQ